MGEENEKYGRILKHLHCSVTVYWVEDDSSCLPHPEARIVGLPPATLLYLPSTRVYPKVSGLAARGKTCKWYSSLPLGAVVSLFYESV
jgi:hypothetical protein